MNRGLLLAVRRVIEVLKSPLGQNTAVDSQLVHYYVPHYVPY